MGGYHGPASGGYGSGTLNDDAYLAWLAEQEAAAQAAPPPAGPASQGYGEAPPQQAAPPPQEAPPPESYPAPDQGATVLGSNATLPPGYYAEPVDGGQGGYQVSPYQAPPPIDDQNAAINAAYAGYSDEEKRAMVAEGGYPAAPPSTGSLQPQFDVMGGDRDYIGRAPAGMRTVRGEGRPAVTGLPGFVTNAPRTGTSDPRQVPVTTPGAGVVGLPERGGFADIVFEYQKAPAPPQDMSTAIATAYVGMNRQQKERAAAQEQVDILNAPRAPMGFPGPYGHAAGTDWMARTPEPAGGAYPNPLAEPGQPGSETPRGRLLGYPEPQGDTLDQALAAGINQAAMGIAGFVGPKAQAVGDLINANPALREAAGKISQAPLLPPGGMMLTGPVGTTLTDEKGEPTQAPTFGEAGEAIGGFLGGPGSFTDKVGAVFQKGVEGVAQYDRPRGWNVETLGEMAIAEISGGNVMDVARARSPQLAGLYGQYYKNDALTVWVREHPEEALSAYREGYGLDPATGEPFTGGRAVWEAFVADKNVFSKLLLDLTHDPTMLAPTGRAITEVGEGVARAAGKPGLAAAVGALGKTVDAASDPLQLAVEVGGPIFRETPRSVAEGEVATAQRALGDVGSLMNAQEADAPAAGTATDIPDPTNIGTAEATVTRQGEVVDTPPPPAPGGRETAQAAVHEAEPGEVAPDVPAPRDARFPTWPEPPPSYIPRGRTAEDTWPGPPPPDPENPTWPRPLDPENPTWLVPPRSPAPSPNGRQAPTEAAPAPPASAVTVENGQPRVAPPPEELTRPPAARGGETLPDAYRRMVEEPNAATWDTPEERAVRGDIYVASRRQAEDAYVAVLNGDRNPGTSEWAMRAKPPTPVADLPPGASPAQQRRHEASLARQAVEQEQYDRYLDAIVPAYQQNPVAFEGVRAPDGTLVPGQEGAFAGRRPEGTRDRPYDPRTIQEIKRRAAQRGPAPEARPTGRAGSVPGEERGVVPGRRPSINARLADGRPAENTLVAPPDYESNLRAEARQSGGVATGDYWNNLLPVQRAQMDEWAQRLRGELNRLGLTDVELIVERVLGAIDPKMHRRAGYFDEDATSRWIALAYQDYADMSGTLSHEVVHAIRQMGLIKPAEWDAVMDDLARILDPEDPNGRTFIDSVSEEHQDHYRDWAPAERDEALKQEALANAYTTYLSDPGRFAPATQTVFERIKSFLDTIYRAITNRPPHLRTGGASTDLFQRITSGEVGARQRPGAAAPAPGSRPSFMSEPPNAPARRQRIADFLARTSVDAANFGTTQAPRPTGRLSGVRNVPNRVGRHYNMGGRVDTGDEAGTWGQRLGTPGKPVPLGPTTERVLDQRLGTTNPGALPTELVGRQIGEVYLETRNELKAAQRLAQSGSRTAKQQATVDRVAKKHGIDEMAAQIRKEGGDAENTSILAGMTPDQLNALANLKVQTYMIADRGLDKPAGGLYNVPLLGGGLRGMDAYNRFTRENVLTGNANAARYILQQYAFNPVTGAIGGTLGSSLKASNPLSVARGYKTMASGQLQPDSPYLKQLSRIGKAPNVRDMVQAGERDMLGTGGETVYGKTSKAANRLGKPGAIAQAVGRRFIRQPEVRVLANAIDFAHREAMGAARVERAIGPLHAGLRKHAADLARKKGLLIDQNGVDQALRALEASGRTDAVAVRNILLPFAADNQAAKGWAERVARDWEEATGEAVRRAEADVARVFFSGKETNADALLSRLVSFHYWISRASRLYARQGLRNPALMAAYARGLEWQERNAHPTWKLFVEWMANDSRAAHTAWWSPFAAAATLLTFADEGERTQVGMTDAGKLRDNIPVMLAPALSEIWYESGKGGKEWVPNVGGVRNELWSYANMLKWAAEAGVIPWDTVAREIDGMGHPDEFLAKKIVQIRQAAFEKVGGVAPPSPNPEGSRIQEFNNIVEQMVREKWSGDWTPEMVAEYDQFVRTLNPGVPPEDALYLFLDRKATDALNDPDSQEQADADELLTTKRAIQSINTFANPFYARFTLDSKEANDELAAKAYDDEEDSGAEQFAAFLNQVDGTTDPRGRELLLAEQEMWSIINNEEAQAAYDARQKIATGEIDSPIQVTGEDGVVYVYGPDDIEDLRQRGIAKKNDEFYYLRALADLWSYQQGDLGLIRDWQANKSAILEEHPDLAASENLEYYAEDYDAKHGKGAFVADTRATNPAYDAYVTNLESLRDEGIISPASFEKKLLNWEAYAAVQGWGGSPYDLLPESTGEIAGGLTPAEALAANPRTAGNDDYLVERAAAIPEDLRKYDAVATAFRAAGFDPALLASYGDYDPNVPGSGIGDAAYDQLEIIAANALGLPIRQSKAGHWYFYGGGDDYAPNDAYRKQASAWIADQVYLDDDAAAFRASGYGSPTAWFASPAYQAWNREHTWFDPAAYPPH